MKRRGRPPTAGGRDSVALTVRVPAATYDRLTSIAGRAGEDVAPLVRRILATAARRRSFVLKNRQLRQSAAS